MRYYKISEDKLKEFLETSLEMWMLNQDGVDNWSWYGASRRDIIEEFIPDSNKDITFSDIAEILLKDYEVISE